MVLISLSTSVVFLIRGENVLPSKRRRDEENSKGQELRNFTRNYDAAQYWKTNRIQKNRKKPEMAKYLVTDEEKRTQWRRNSSLASQARLLLQLFKKYSKAHFLELNKL